MYRELAERLKRQCEEEQERECLLFSGTGSPLPPSLLETNIAVNGVEDDAVAELRAEILSSAEYKKQTVRLVSPIKAQKASLSVAQPVRSTLTQPVSQLSFQTPSQNSTMPPTEHVNKHEWQKTIIEIIKKMQSSPLSNKFSYPACKRSISLEAINQSVKDPSTNREQLYKDLFIICLNALLSIGENTDECAIVLEFWSQIDLCITNLANKSA